MATTIALVEHGADVNYMARLWATPLHYMVKFGAKEKIVYLLENGADPRIKSAVSRVTAAECARRDGRVELAEILEERMERMERKSRRLRGLDPVQV
jgi:ankyrin repeat protein